MSPVGWLLLIIGAVLWPLVALTRQEDLDGWDAHWSDIEDLFG